MYAWIDLKHKKAEGKHVNEKDYKKHKNDVFRLLRIVDVEKRTEVQGIVRDISETCICKKEARGNATSQDPSR